MSRSSLTARYFSSYRKSGAKTGFADDVLVPTPNSLNASQRGTIHHTDSASSVEGIASLFCDFKSSAQEVPYNNCSQQQAFEGTGA